MTYTHLTDPLATSIDTQADLGGGGPVRRLDRKTAQDFPARQLEGAVRVFEPQSEHQPYQQIESVVCAHSQRRVLLLVSIPGHQLAVPLLRRRH